jgi:hypothetical protein
MTFLVGARSIAWRVFGGGGKKLFVVSLLLLGFRWRRVIGNFSQHDDSTSLTTSIKF